MGGYSGNDGMGWPHRLLTLDGTSRERLLASEEIYRRAYTSAVMTRLVDVPTISTAVSCMTLCVGFDATRLLPPFFPALRSADFLFGVTLARCDPTAAVMFTPDVVEHKPRVARSRDAESIWSCTGWRMTHLLAAITWSTDVSGAGGVASRLRRLGHAMRRASMERDGFRAALESLWRNALVTRVALLEQYRKRYDFAPAFWDGDVARYIDSIRRHLLDPRNAIPIDVHGGSYNERLGAAQVLVQRYGALLIRWPDIWAAAERANGATGARIR
jgi:hypothetical protein